MRLKLKTYQQQLVNWPESGRHIMAQYDSDRIVVYQAYRPAIGHFAAQHQFFGGEFKRDRMTWIKPNFLWVMYRSGWGSKPDQEVTLAIHLKRSAFEQYLRASVKSSFDASKNDHYEAWKTAVAQSDCRLQWDPDHGPYGEKLERRAVQLGIRKSLVDTYVKEDILEIEDISDYVARQRNFVRLKQLGKLETPEEHRLKLHDTALATHLNLDEHGTE